MTSLEISDSPQLKLMHSFIEGFKNRDLDQIAKLLHKDHRRITYPRSLGKPEQTKEEYLQHSAELVKLWVDSDVSCTRDRHSNPLPQLNRPHSRSSIPSLKLRGRSSLTSVQQTLRYSTPRILTRSTHLIAHQQGEYLHRGADESRNDPHRTRRSRRRRKLEAQAD
jgi:hypothetical protein